MASWAWVEKSSGARTSATSFMRELSASNAPSTARSAERSSVARFTSAHPCAPDIVTRSVVELRAAQSGLEQPLRSSDARNDKGRPDAPRKWSASMAALDVRQLHDPMHGGTGSAEAAGVRISECTGLGVVLYLDLGC